MIQSRLVMFTNEMRIYLKVILQGVLQGNLVEVSPEVQPKAVLANVKVILLVEEKGGRWQFREEVLEVKLSRVGMVPMVDFPTDPVVGLVLGELLEAVAFRVEMEWVIFLEDYREEDFLEDRMVEDFMGECQVEVSPLGLEV